MVGNHGRGQGKQVPPYVGFLDDCEQLPKGYLSLIEKFQDSDFHGSWWDSQNIKDTLPDDGRK